MTAPITPVVKKQMSLPGARILLVVGAYHRAVLDQMVKGATAAIEAASAKADILEAPGAFEIPGAIMFASGAGAYDGYVALGCVVKGDTDHYDYICAETSRGLMDLSKNGFCIGFGLLTVHSLAQAEERADTRRGDKGGEAAQACLTMIEIKRRFTGARA